MPKLYKVATTGIDNSDPLKPTGNVTLGFTAVSASFLHLGLGPAVELQSPSTGSPWSST